MSTLDSTLNLQFSKLKYDQTPNGTFPPYGGVQMVHVEPVVMVSVMDHYVREYVEEENNTIVGALFGNRSNYGAVVNVKSCFPVKIVREEKANRVDYRYSGDTFRKMFALTEQANTGYVFVGWYSIGTEIGILSKVVKDIFEQANLIRGQAVYLLVDNSFKMESLGVSAYASVPAGVSCAKTPGVMCVPVNCVIGKLDKFTNDDMVLKTTALKERVTDLPSNLENMEYFVNYLRTLIKGLISYVDQVLAKKTPANAAIGRHMMDIILSYSTFDLESCNEKFGNNLHDILFISYLATLAKSQLAVTDKIQKLSVHRYFSD